MDRLIHSKIQKSRKHLGKHSSNRCAFDTNQNIRLKSIIYRDFGSDLGLLILNFFPSLSARNGFRGRKIVSEAFFEYFQNNSHESGSTLVQTRYNTSIRNQIPVADIARFEVGGAIAVLINTAPTTFWMFFHVYSNVESLKDIRDEVASIMTTTVNRDGTQTRILEMASIKSKCPILTSTFQEVLRHHSVSVGVRQVMEDTLLNNKYLLRKDSTIFMPNIVTHQDPSIWGADVSTFDHKRFIKGQRANASAFRAFGGGSTLCPGRHFATTEILAMVAMALMRYDISPVAGNAWLAPSTGKTNIAAAVNEPDYDIEVEVKARKGFETGQWLFGLGNSDMVFAVAAEDKPKTND